MTGKELMPHELQAINKAIDFFDETLSGFIPTTSLGGLLRWLKLIPTEREIQELTITLDPEKSGKIRRKYLIPVITERWNSVPQEFEAKLWEAFLVFDKNDKGFLSEETVRSILLIIGMEPIPEKEVRKIIAEFQDPKTGMIDYGQMIRRWQE